MPDPSAAAATPSPRKPGRRIFGLAVKGVLGCAAIAFGAFVALVLLLPRLIGGPVKSGAEAFFADTYHGKLEIGKVDLSWFKPQAVSDAVIYDPEHVEIARCSATLPSILDVLGSKKTLKGDVTVSANLVADDQGVTNLQRALAPRHPKPESTRDDDDERGGGGDPLGDLSRLSLDFHLSAPQVSWSDAETRKAGKSFELRDLDARILTAPGEPLTLKTTGKVVADAPGEIAVEATAFGPLDSGNAWPVGPVDASVRITGFSTAMIDGVAGLGGKLSEVLGPRFDLKIDLQRVTPQQGDLDLELVSQRTKFGFGGRFEGGFLRTRDDAPVKATIGPPRGFVAGLIAPALPPDVKVAWEESDAPWTVQISNLALPIPDAGAPDMKAVAKALEHLSCQIDFDMPARVTLESESLKAAGDVVGVEELVTHVAIEPGQPARLKVGAKLIGAADGAFDLDATVHEPWKAVAEGAIPVVDATVRATVPTAAIDAILGQKEPMLASFGPKLALETTARGASPQSGELDVRIQVQGPDARKLELVLGGKFDGGKCVGNVRIDVHDPAALFERFVAPALPPSLPVTLTGGAISISAPNFVVPIDAPLGPGLSIQVACDVRGLKLRDGVASVLLGASMTPEGAVTLQAEAGALESIVSVKVSAVEGRQLLDVKSRGVPPFEATLGLRGAGLVRAFVDPATLVGTPGAVLTLPKTLEANVTISSAQSAPIEPSVLPLLEGLNVTLDARADAVGYSDERTKAAKAEPELRGIQVTGHLERGKPFTVGLSSTISTSRTGPPGRFTADATVSDPWFFLRGESAQLPPVDANVRLIDLPTASLDAFSGRPGLLSGLFGDKLQITLAAKEASTQGGSVRLDVTSKDASVAVSGRMEQGSIVSTDEPALAIEATLSQPWLDQQVGPLLPQGSRLAIGGGASPIRLTVRDLRFPLPQSAMSADALAAASMRFDAALPELTYSDPQGAQTKSPAIVRELKIQANLAPDKLPSATIVAKIDGDPPGELSATIQALDPLTLAAEEKGIERFRVSADARGKGLPTALVDALAARGGLLVDVLGPRLDLTLKSEGISLAEGNFTATLDSQHASVRIDRGGLKDKTLVLEKATPQKKEALLAQVELTPLFSERAIGQLVPLFVQLEKPPEKKDEKVALAVEELSFPLDADLSKLDAVVRLNLGEVAYKLLPGLDALLGAAQVKTIVIPEIRMPIEKGVVKYDSLPIRAGKHELAFRGSFSLVDQSLKLDTEVPLALLGKAVSGKLDDLRGLLDPNTKVPLEVRGTWKSPKVRVGDDFLKRVAEDALKNQGGDLLEGLLKKKKKN